MNSKECSVSNANALFVYSFMSGLRDEELEPREEVDQLPKFGFDGKRLVKNK